VKKINRRTPYATAAAAVLSESIPSTAATRPLRAQRTLTVSSYFVTTVEEAAVTLENLIGEPMETGGVVEIEHMSLCPNLANDAYVLLVIFSSGAPES
jgi:hypothetical protein